MWRTAEFGKCRWMQILIRWSYFIPVWSWFTQSLYFPVAEARGKSSRSALAWYKALTNNPCPEKGIFPMGKNQDLRATVHMRTIIILLYVSGLNFLYAPLIFAAWKSSIKGNNIMWCCCCKILVARKDWDKSFM